MNYGLVILGWHYLRQECQYIKMQICALVSVVVFGVSLTQENGTDGNPDMFTGCSISCGVLCLEERPVPSSMV